MGSTEESVRCKKCRLNSSLKNNTCPSLKKALLNLKINLSNNLKIEIPTKNKSRKSDLKNEDKEKSNESHIEKNSTITDENTHNDNNNAKIAKNSTKSKKRNLKTRPQTIWMSWH